MINIITKIRSLIRQSIITLITDDSEKYPLMQVNYNGKTAYAIRVSPYGLCSNPGADMFSLVLNSGGNESQKFGIPMDLLNRKKDLKDWEVALHNSKTGSTVYLKDDGVIEINGSDDFAIAYTDMKTAFDVLKSEVNANITKMNGHTHNSQVPANSVPVPVAIADMSGAKVPTIKVP